MATTELAMWVSAMRCTGANRSFATAIGQESQETDQARSSAKVDYCPLTFIAQRQLREKSVLPWVTGPIVTTEAIGLLAELIAALSTGLSKPDIALANASRNRQIACLLIMVARAPDVSGNLMKSISVRR